jgi:threonine/homoserine/homoserine lactone efflux protein
VHNTFIATLLLTLSNPLTIIFWTGVFSTRVVDDGMSKRDMYVFGTGAVLSTALFLTSVSYLGAIAGVFVTSGLMQAMNGLVGLVLIGFSVKGLARIRSAQ